MSNAQKLCHCTKCILVRRTRLAEQRKHIRAASQQQLQTNRKRMQQIMVNRRRLQQKRTREEEQPVRTIIPKSPTAAISVRYQTPSAFSRSRFLPLRPPVSAVGKVSPLRNVVLPSSSPMMQKNLAQRSQRIALVRQRQQVQREKEQQVQREKARKVQLKNQLQRVEQEKLQLLLQQQQREKLQYERKQLQTIIVPRTRLLTAQSTERQRKLQLLLARLKQYNLVRVPTLGDGNCQFHALATFCDSKTVGHGEIRQRVVQYIAANRERFETDVKFSESVRGRNYSSVDEYCANMSKNGHWGDGISLMAFCLAFDINVRLFTEAGITELYPGEKREMISMVRFGEHYEATQEQKWKT